MTYNINKFIIWLLFLYFISPYGFGISNFLFLNSFDIPKIVPLIFFIIVLLNFNFNKIDKSILLFIIFIFLHSLSVLYSPMNDKSIIDFTSNLILFYSGFFIPFLIIDSKTSLKNLMLSFNVIFISYTIFSITEFLFQFNFFDLIRNSYEESEGFNNQLGIIRLGYKSSMGPFASTLPFAYSFTTLFFLRELYKPKFISNFVSSSFLTVLGIFAIFFTFSRAAIIILIFLLIIKNIFQKNVRRILLFVSGFLLIFYFVSKSIENTVFQDYIQNYVTNIFEDEDFGMEYRANNNIIDFNYALNKPIFGHGAGMLYQDKIGGIRLESSDSSYLLTIFADRGILSLLVFLTLFVITLFRSIDISRKKSEYFKFRSLTLALFAIFLCLNSSQRVEVLFLFFFLMGMINKIYLINKKLC